MSEAPKTVFVTQYALSGGISEREVVRMDDDGYVVVRWPGGINGTAIFRQSQYAMDRPAAAKQAATMRDAKLRSFAG